MIFWRPVNWQAVAVLVAFVLLLWLLLYYLKKNNVNWKKTQGVIVHKVNFLKKLWKAELISRAFEVNCPAFARQEGKKRSSSV